jgi:YD repeat-containing protein
VTGQEERGATGGRTIQIDRDRDERGRVTRIALRVAGVRDVLRSIVLEYDAEGRLIELHDESAVRSYRLSYRYDAAGGLEEEVLVRWSHADDLVIQTASHQRDGTVEELRRVEVRDGVGHLLQVASYATHGGILDSRSYDLAGRLARHERSEFHDDGRMARSWRFIYDEPGRAPGEDRPSRRLREDYTYDPESNSLTRRRLTEEIPIVDHPSRGTWRTTVDEVIQYAHGLPLRDETRFLEVDASGRVTECQRLEIDYQYDVERRLVEMRVVEQDLRTGEIHHRVSRFGHRQVPEGATGPLLREIWCEAGDRRESQPEAPQDEFDCRVDRLYQADGELRRLMIYERNSRLPAGVFVYD